MAVKKATPAKQKPLVKKAQPAKKPAPVKEDKDSKKVYHLTKRKEDGMWAITFVGGTKAVKLFKTKKEAEEYTMGFPFDFTTKTIKKVNNKMHIRMNNSPIHYDGSIFNDKIMLNTEESYTSFNNVMYFLEEIYKNGCLENYFQSIKEFFDMSLDLGLLFDAWHETHNKRKALTLYKHRVISKRI